MTGPAPQAEPTGYLQMDDEYGQLCRTGWTGPWPPPEKMVLIESLISPYPTWTELPSTETHRKALAEGLSLGWKVHLIERVSYSKISDEDMVGMTHAVRGAEYHVTGEYTP